MFICIFLQIMNILHDDDDDDEDENEKANEPEEKREEKRAVELNNESQDVKAVVAKLTFPCEVRDYTDI